MPCISHQYKIMICGKSDRPKTEALAISITISEAAVIRHGFVVPDVKANS
jgi:hypothetical protein